MVPDPQQDVDGHHTGIDDIEDERQIIVFQHDLGCDAAEIADQDKAAEKDALPAGAFADPHAPDGQRPGDAEAQDHNGLKN